MLSKNDLFARWEKQIELKHADGKGGYCAVGRMEYAHFKLGISQDYVRRQARLIGEYIQANYNLPKTYVHPVEECTYYPRENPLAATVYANNVLHISIERFKAIDEYIQVRTALARTEALADIESINASVEELVTA